MAPAHWLGRGWDFHHGNTAIHRTDEAAEIASHAVRLTHDGDRFAQHSPRSVANPGGFRVEQINALMGAILAGDMAEITPDAGVVVDAGYAFEVEIQILPFVK